MPYALFALLAAVPLIVFLHGRRPGGRRVRTTALFIWERVLNERPLATRLGWFLRRNLLLVLQLLAAVLLVAALAEPALTRFGASPGDTVVVMDLTASMKARGTAGTRFDAARREFLSLVDALPAGGRMMLIGAGAEFRLIVPFTGDRQRLREAGRELAPSDAAGAVKDAVLLAHAFLRKGDRDRIVVISDGAFDGAEELARESARVRLIPVRGGTQNVGIVSLALRRRPEGAGRHEVMAHVRNFGTAAVRVPLTISLGSTLVAREELVLEPGARRVIVRPWKGDPAGTLVAALEIDDDFATDNRAVLTTGAAPPLRLLYVGPGNPALARLLRVFPDVQFSAVTDWEEVAARGEAGRAGGGYDAIIFDRVAVPELTEGNVILVNTTAPNLPLGVLGEARNPRVTGALARHPVTAGVNLADLAVRAALRVSAQGESVVLARGTDGPLLVAFERARLRALFIGFDLAASDLPYRVAFPLLFHNAFEWFRPGRGEFPAESARAGAALPLFAAPGDREVEVTTPSGRKEKLAVSANPLVFGDTLEAGVYAYRSAGREGRFAVNLFDEAESDIRSRIGSAATGEPAGEPGEGGANGGLELWPFLLPAVLLLFLVEIAFARRAGLAALPFLLRAAALATLAAACVNPRMFRGGEALDVILSVDVSRSVGQEGTDMARGLLDEVRRVKGADTRTGLLTFARTPEWEFLPRRELPPAEPAARLDRDATDLQSALRAALAQLGEGREGRILVVSDGNENRGSSARLVPLLRSRGTQVWTLPVNLARGRNEVFVSELALPGRVDSAEAFPVSGRIESLRAAPARVTLLRDGVPVGERELALRAGTNEVGFGDSLGERGSHGYELVVEAQDDTFAENNLLQGVVEVRGPPRVLLVSSEPESQRFLARALRVQGYAVVESAPEASTFALPELASYDLLVLDNVPAFQLTHAKMENVETYVRDLGGGLLVVGGSRSYGAGGYLRTPLERVLPVDMRPPARLDLPHVALVFVIDKSGSMGVGAEGGTKLDLAKAAAIAAADIMNPADQIGILSFDAAWNWTVPFRRVGRGEWVSGSFAALRSDGGTDLYKAMVEARRAILEKDAAVKHVIVLSDGLAEKADFQPLVRELAAAGVTVSTVSVGEDADSKLLAEIAREGRGRGYVAVDPQLVPRIFTAETLLVSRDLLIEKTVAPRLAAGAGPLRGIAPDTLPALRGYVLTYPKPRAERLMSAGEDPLLVSWRYGLGRVMAFTSDLSGRWGRDWAAWRGLPLWAGQIARVTMRRTLESGVRAEFHAEGGAVRIVADFVSGEGGFVNELKLHARIAGPDRTTQHEALLQSAPGRYEGTFAPAGRGIHLVTLFAEGGAAEAPSAVVTIPYVAPYPGEYRELRPNLALLARLAAETGGETLDPDDPAAGLRRLYTPSPGRASRGSDSWRALAGVALLLFLADLVARSSPRRARPSARSRPREEGEAAGESRSAAA
ncbi:MAG: VWA domain-containing protein [Burkholderiales bacterium]|nr:VWA domain-containing protein [Burkholderiales bacterium]